MVEDNGMVEVDRDPIWNNHMAKNIREVDDEWNPFHQRDESDFCDEELFSDERVDEEEDEFSEEEDGISDT
ncbi:hypothetical protein L2E82_19682 [Cichorium intybus]|uniref:Uncharacterized protein n=1 Tax=Cichorium intybus TaxID=13427 RepID=A0ACB9FCX0_CICIN|nr:hypothetical protein L2E82_19682 [Cichorium intybus]